MPFTSLTRAILRNAEFGFFGVVVETRVHTPRRWGEPWSAGVAVFSFLNFRSLRTSWFVVGTVAPAFLSVEKGSTTKSCAAASEACYPEVTVRNRDAIF